MRKIAFCFSFVLLAIVSVSGQKTDLSVFYKDGDKMSLGVATNINRAIALLENVAEHMASERNYSLKFVSGFSSVDTILELISVEYEEEMPFENPPSYLINMSSGLHVNSYRQLLADAKKELIREHYIYDEVYADLLLAIQNIFERPVELYLLSDDELNQYAAYFHEPIAKRIPKNPMYIIPKGKEQEYVAFYKEVIVLGVENGNLEHFQEYPQLVDVDMQKAGIAQLANPQWPKQYAEQFMEDNFHLWDPAHIDTTGILSFCFDDKNLALQQCQDYVEVITNFKYYEQGSKQLGISPQELLYNEVKSSYHKAGYKPVKYLIQYALDEEDQQMLDALKIFVKTHPNYQLTEQEAKVYREIQNFLDSSRK